MTSLKSLRVPIIAAPMAGGPSTPELVLAVEAAGGLGFLASGTIGVDELNRQLAEVDGHRYAVNLFAAQAPLSSLDPVHAFIEEVGLDVDKLPDVDYSNGWEAKLEAILAAPTAPVAVSSTFGPFTVDEIERLHDAGIEAWITVTNPDDAATAEHLGADVLVVQGPEAGGHRSTWDVAAEPDKRSLRELLDAIETRLPVVAAGGITTDTIAEFARLADAVSVGSAFLLAEEAGTKELSRTMLIEGGTSVSSRGFSGRVARGLETEFTRTHDVPAIYPYVNKLLASKRQDPAFAYCLVGTSWDTQTRKAADIVDRLAQAL